MKMSKGVFIIIALVFTFSNQLSAQVEEAQTGAWYMYFYDAKFKESKFGVQGDIQYRNWNLLGDLEQLLLRSGLTYRPGNTNVKLTLGYAHITTGTPDESTDTTTESRIYQEAFLPQQIGKHIYINHRFRYEQRFVENQDFRTRYRYNLFLTVPLNTKTIEAKTVYVALYNELFINAQRDIGNGNTVQIFDRNRFYAALGYAFSKDLKVQLGMMRQTTNNWDKRQLQVSCHHNF